MVEHVPGWQTEELGEEWVESSPSPPATLHETPKAASINEKRGSLRALGQGAAARALPPSRKGSASGAPEYARSPSNPFIRAASGMPSPPTSASGDEGEHELNGDAGTFQVKDGEDTHGKAFPRNPFTPGLQGSRDMFSALALERMFEPPSPPVVGGPSTTLDADQPQHPNVSATETAPSASTTPTSSPERTSQPLGSIAQQASAATTARRLSHQYAPINPSRLSKSITPSDNSFLTSVESSRVSTPVPPSDDTQDADEHNVTVSQEECFASHSSAPSVHDLDGDFSESHQLNRHDPMAKSDISQSSDVNRRRDSTPEVNHDHDRSQGTVRYLSPFGDEEPSETPSPVASPDYRFTFSAEVPHGSSDFTDPVFEPSLEPLEGGEPSHSTLNHPDPIRLRLFNRNGYDTYTREHLSALVDSIAVKRSCSASSLPDASHLRDWSPARSDSLSSPNSGGVMSTPSSGSTFSDVRSSKRLRLSPPSPRLPAPTRDWKARGRAMMDRLRLNDSVDFSITSESPSRSEGTRSDGSIASNVRSRVSSEGGGTFYHGGPTVDYDDIPPSPQVVDTAPAGNTGEPYRSNPSTASSGYLQHAEDMMSRMRLRLVSPATSTVDGNDSLRQTGGSSVDLSKDSPARSDQRWLSSADSPRPAETSLSSAEAEQSPVQHGENDSIIEEGGRSSLGGTGQPPRAPVRRDDLSRFISSSTVQTATTISTSFVKHPGPRDSHQSRITMIRPGDIHGVVPDRIGKMTYDPVKMRWVRHITGLGPVAEAGESRLTGSEESSDAFAGFETSADQSERSNDEPEDDVLTEVIQPVEDHDDSSDSVSDRSADEAHTTPPGQHAGLPSYDVTPDALFKRSAQHVPSSPQTTPLMAGPGTPGVGNALRSALRNPNSTPISAMKKRAAWHADLTPGHGRGQSAVANNSFKRSVSFSDGFVATRVFETNGDNKKHVGRASNASEEVFSDNRTHELDGVASVSWQPSARTRRILHDLDDLADEVTDLLIDDASVEGSSSDYLTRTHKPGMGIEEGHDGTDDTIQTPRFGRSTRLTRSRSRAANATFLTECSFGLAHDRLVQLITDVQPFEPYWEQLRAIDLSGRGVETLARLKEFLPALDEARFNENMIEYLSGIPSTVRTLHVAANKLSSLTSVAHLLNLQYLDISRNQLDSVAQLECLRHLRELKADNNSIASLNGIMNMDCLVKISMAGNKIDRVDFANSRWSKLESLNLSNNRIRRIEGLEALTSVAVLNLDNNRIEVLEPDTPMTSVRVLRFSDNCVAHLDLSLFPKVCTMYADGNRLSALSRSASGGHRVENLSVRNQHVQRFFLSAEDLGCVKRLYISGNRLEPDWLPKSPIYSLLYLEAAACHIASWPSRFAARVPNLRILNINYNFVEDLDGLQGLARLRKLTAVGCRLGGSPGPRRIVKGLNGLTSLEEVDLRMNPSTLSFYLPILVPQTTSRSKQAAVGRGQKCQGSQGASAVVAAQTESSKDWSALDQQFRRQLPDTWYSKRLCYRGLVMRACPEIKTLDGVAVEGSERIKAGQLLERAAITSGLLS